MKLMKLKSPFGSLLVAALLVGLPFLGSEAQARGGGGGHGGGFSGGSFRGGGGYATGPRGRRGLQEGPGVGRRGGGPEDQEDRLPIAPPGGTYSANVNVNRNVNVSGNWNAYRGPGYGGVAAGVAVGLAVGAVVGTLPATAAARSVAGQTYYYDGGNYYQPCYQGTDVNYCVVPDPNQ